MKEESFQQKRIVQLSRQLDAERDKCNKLIKDSTFLNAKLKQTQQEIEQNKQKIIQYQINNHQLTERIREIDRDNQRFRDQVDRQQKLRSEAQVDNVRQRQKIDQLKLEMQDYENKTKAILYERTCQLSIKDKEIYRLKEENLQIEKLYINQRERLQRKQEKHLRELTKLMQEFQAYKKELAGLKAYSLQSIRDQKQRWQQEIEAVQDRLNQIQSRLRKQQQMQAQIEQMKLKLQDVVIQNSQKIIELYKYKYA